MELDSPSIVGCLPIVVKVRSKLDAAAVIFR